MKPIYVSATVQDSGKTSVSLGLMQILQQQQRNPGYIKPVGQRYVPYHQKNIDEDAVLMHQAFRLPEEPYYLSPIAIERGFTSNFIFNPVVAPLEQRILECVGLLRRNHPVVIVEGTGHAGVGSCFNLSNARVAELLGAKVVIVTGGGIGRPIDEVAVNLALFRQHNVDVLGVVLNKVLPDKYDKVRAAAAQGLKNIGTRLLGAIPYDRSLTFFTMEQIAEEFKYKVIWGHEALTNRIENTVVAAMEPAHVVQYIHQNTLVIAPGDRIDNILVSVMVLCQDCNQTGGLILTGGIEPHPTIARLIQGRRIPVLLSEDDTFTVSSRMADLGFKIRSCDGDKITMLHSLVERYVDIQYILNALAELTD